MRRRVKGKTLTLRLTAFARLLDQPSLDHDTDDGVLEILRQFVQSSIGSTSLKPKMVSSRES